MFPCVAVCTQGDQVDCYNIPGDYTTLLTLTESITSLPPHHTHGPPACQYEPLSTLHLTVCLLILISRK